MNQLPSMRFLYAIVLSFVIFLFVKICLSIFPFDVWDRLWVLIRPVPEVSFLLQFINSKYKANSLEYEIQVS